jgi:hypothetical protein
VSHFLDRRDARRGRAPSRLSRMAVPAGLAHGLVRIRSFALSSLVGFAALVVLIALLYLGRGPTGATGSVQVTGSESMQKHVGNNDP